MTAVFDWNAWDNVDTDALPLHMAFQDVPPYLRDRVHAEIEDASEPEDVPKWVRTLTGLPANWTWHEIHRQFEHEAAWNDAYGEQAERDRAAANAESAQEKENDKALQRLRATEAARETLAAEKADAEGVRSVSDMRMTASELMSATPPPAIITGVLDGGGLSMLVAARATGKTFIALDMALSVATGRQWGNHTTNPEKGRALYLVGEGGGRAFGIRLEAWARHHGVTDLVRHFLAINGAVPFMSTRWNELVEIAAEFDPDMIVVDTLSRHAIGLEENSNTDAATGINKAEALRARTGAAVMVLHHPAKNSAGGVNGRGAGAWEGAVDAVFVLDKDDDEGTASDGAVVEMLCTKQKHRADGQRWAWRFETVPVTPNGTWDASLVPVPADPFSLPSTLAQRAAATTKANAVTRWLLDRIAEAPGKSASSYYRGPGVERTVEVDGKAVPFSITDARSALEKLEAEGQVIKTEINRQKSTLSVAPGDAS